MKEVQRAAKLFEELYDGTPWIHVNLVSVLTLIDAKQASKSISPSCHSIWEIANHLISWRQNVLQRVQGKITKAPTDNYFRPIEDISENAWKETLQMLEHSQQQWVNFFKTLKEEDFDKVYPGGSQMTYYEYIHGILQHDAYHLGQIVLLAKFK